MIYQWKLKLTAGGNTEFSEFPFKRVMEIRKMSAIINSFILKIVFYNDFFEEMFGVYVASRSFCYSKIICVATYWIIKILLAWRAHSHRVFRAQLANFSAPGARDSVVALGARSYIFSLHWENSFFESKKHFFDIRTKKIYFWIKESFVNSKKISLM